MREYNPYDLADEIERIYPKFCEAKGHLAQFESFKHSLKAIEMSKSEATTIGGKEMDAYKSQAYQELCEAIGLATQESEMYKQAIDLAKLKWETWRTEQANNRNIDRMTR
jgi:hypothetical protein